MTDLEVFLKSKKFIATVRGEWPEAQKYINQFSIREEVVKKYSFAILTEGMIEKLKKYQPILEVGAGLGYWTYKFQKRKIECVHLGVSLVK